MLSRTKIKSRISKKTNPELGETLSLALKNPSWAEVAKLVSGPSNLYSKINLSQIDSQTKAGDTVLIVGKILSQGNVTKKLRICALSISELALEKLKDSKSDFVLIKDEIKKNPKMEGVKIIR